LSARVSSIGSPTFWKTARSPTSLPLPLVRTRAGGQKRWDQGAKGHGLRNPRTQARKENC
jgi:hypothetical protein